MPAARPAAPSSLFDISKGFERFEAKMCKGPPVEYQWAFVKLAKTN